MRQHLRVEVFGSGLLGGLLVFALPAVLLAQADTVQSVAPAAPLTSYEVTSVRVNTSMKNVMSWGTDASGLKMENINILYVLKSAYEMADATDDQISGLPGWAKTEHFDISGKVGPDDVAAFKKLDEHQRALMLQALLRDRFKLAAHVERRPGSVYALVVAKGGSKLIKSSKPDPTADHDLPESGAGMRPGMFLVNNGHMEANSVPLANLVGMLSGQMERTVIDATGMTGYYTMKLDWMTPGEAAEGASASSAPELQTALQEQLGLKLESRRMPVPVLVIDHLEPPTAN